MEVKLMTDQEKMRKKLKEVYQLLQNAYSKDDTFELYSIYRAMDEIISEDLIYPLYNS